MRLLVFGIDGKCRDTTRIKELPLCSQNSRMNQIGRSSRLFISCSDYMYSMIAAIRDRHR